MQVLLQEGYSLLSMRVEGVLGPHSLNKRVLLLYEELEGAVKGKGDTGINDR